MKRYLLIAVLALTFSFSGIVSAEQGSGDDGSSVSGTSIHQDDDREDQQEDESLDDRDEREQERTELPPPPLIAPIGAPDDRRGEREGLFQLFKKERSENQQQRQDFLNITQQERKELQETRKTEVGNLKESRAALEAAIKEKRDALKAQIEKVKTEKATVRKTFVETHFTEAFAGLNTLTDRIQSKIDELSGKGYDLKDASAALAAAKDSLSKAKADLAALKAATVSDTNTATVTKSRELAKQVETDLKAAHDHFHDAIQAIKTAIGIPADSTPAQNQQTGQQ